MSTDYAERLPPDCLMSEGALQPLADPEQALLQAVLQAVLQAPYNVTLLALDKATLRLPGHRFGPFSMRLAAGERVAILGPSGAGKSTLLRLMSAEYKAHGGEVSFEGQPLHTWPPAALARRRAVLPQSHSVAFDLPVSLVVALGRVARLSDVNADPHQAAIVTQALQLAQAAHLALRRFDTLSGGEQARVQLARVFAQLWDARDALVLVDEPLAALDPGLQFDLMDAMQAFTQARGHALVAVLHDINQALSGFDRLWLLRGGQLQADVASDANAVPALEALYGIGLRIVAGGEGNCDDGEPKDVLAVVPFRRTPHLVHVESAR